MKINEVIPIQLIGYDKYNATQWATDLTQMGMPLQSYSQSIGNFTVPTKALERAIKMGNAVIDDNEITRFCFRNVTLKIDWNENIKPVKGSKQQKIDGVIGMIQALGTYLSVPHYDNDVYGFSV